MTTTTPDPTAIKLDQRTDSLKKARARHRKRQRQEQARRQQHMTQTIEAIAAHKLTDANTQALGHILAVIAPTKINLGHIIGALLEARENLAGPDGSRLRQHYATLAQDYLAGAVAVNPAPGA